MMIPAAPQALLGLKRERAPRSTSAPMLGRNNEVASQLGYAAAAYASREDVYLGLAELLFERAASQEGDHPYTREEFEASRRSIWEAEQAKRSSLPAGVEPGGSWLPVDLAEAAAEDDPPPCFGRRSDDRHLFYAGRIHWLSGEPESLKTWIALVVAVQALLAGRSVAWIDFEDDAKGFLSRLEALGVEPLSFEDRLRYLRPFEALGAGKPGTTPAKEALEELCAWEPELTVIDGVTEAMSSEGLSPDSNPEVAAWLLALPRQLARAGSAVIAIDHVTKSKEGRGRWAIGGQHKLAAIDGAAFTVEVVRPLGRATDKPIEGVARIKVAKDRRGWVRSLADGNGLAAELRITSHPGGTLIAHLEPPAIDTGGDDALRAEVVDFLRDYPGSSTRKVREGIEGHQKIAVDAALRSLVKSGHVEVQKVGVSHQHTLTQVGEKAWAPSLLREGA